MHLRACLTIAFISAHTAAFGATFYVKDQATFNGDVTIAGLPNLGTEDFESSTAVAYQEFNDSLEPGVANGPFPSGTLVTTGMTIQSNTGGQMPSTPSPHGAFGLIDTPPGVVGSPSHQISNNQENHSLDLLFSGGVKAVGLFPAFVLNNSVTTPNGDLGTVDVRVFDMANTLIGTGSITDIGYNVSDHFGVIAGLGELIGRINLSSSGAYTGADTITVFGANPIPEPTIGLLGLAGAFGMLFHRRRAR